MSHIFFRSGVKRMETALTKELIRLGKERVKNLPVEGFVPGQGSLHPLFMLIGEAPGETEIGNLIPFSGRAGKELMKFFDRLEVSREDVYITSTVRSRPYKIKQKVSVKTGEKTIRKYNRPPTKKEIIAHAPLLDAEIQTVNPPIILTMGNIGLKRILGNVGMVTELHGQLYTGPIQKLQSLNSNQFIWTEKNYRVFSTFHPAAIFYNRQLQSLIMVDLTTFKRLIH